MASVKKTENEITTKTIFIPKQYKGDDAQYVSVNGRRRLIKKGMPVSVPLEVAEVIENSLESDAKAEAFINSVASD